MLFSYQTERINELPSHRIIQLYYTDEMRMINKSTTDRLCGQKYKYTSDIHKNVFKILFIHILTTQK